MADRHRLQLASLSSPGSARQTWSDIVRAIPSVANLGEPSVVVARGSGTSRYHILYIEGQKEELVSLCPHLKDFIQTCIVRPAP